MKNLLLRSIAIIITVCVTLLYGCTQKHEANLEIQKVINSDLSFNEYFEYIDSTIIVNKNIDSPVFWYERNNGDIIICNYSDGKVWVQNSRATTLDNINIKTPSYIPTQHPICLAFDDRNNMYVANNGSRRISIFDSTYKSVYSYVITGSHTTPVSMAISSDTLYMCAYNKNDNTFIQQYLTNGTFIKGMMNAYVDVKNYENNWENLNYVHCIASDKNVYAIELMKYKISSFESTGKEINKMILEPDYFIPISDSISNLGKESFEYIRNVFSKPTNIIENKNNLYVQVEMPMKQDKEKNYFDNRRYRIDVLNKRLKVKFSGINCDNYRLIMTDNMSNHVTFLTSLDKDSGKIVIKRFKVKSRFL